MQGNGGELTPKEPCSKSSHDISAGIAHLAHEYQYLERCINETGRQPVKAVQGPQQQSCDLLNKCLESGHTKCRDKWTFITVTIQVSSHLETLQILTSGMGNTHMTDISYNNFN
jgi:hypothetical protein